MDITAHVAPQESGLVLESIVPYLLRTGLASTQDLTAPGASISDVSRRCRNFAVVLGSGSDGFFLKQPRDLADQEATGSVRREGAVLAEIARRPELRAVRWGLPRFVRFDDEACILVTGLLRPSVTLTKVYLNRGAIQFSPETSSRAARLLASFHRGGRAALDSGGFGFLPRKGPFVWSIFDGARDTHLRKAVLEYLKDVRRETAIQRSLEESRRAWDHASHTVIHGDVRWDNILVLPGAGPGGRLNMRLVDWEFGMQGDPAWDVACYLAEHVRFWLLCTSTIATAERVEQAIPGAPFPLAEGARAGSRFWREYARAAGLTATERAAWSERCAAYLPVIIAQLGGELVGRNGSVPTTSRWALEIAMSASEDPRRFAAEWTGERP